MTGQKLSAVCAVLVAMTLSIAAICLPVYARTERPLDSPLFPWIRTGVETIGTTNLWLLFAAGVALGILFGGRRAPIGPLWLGMATMAPFPLLAVAEMVADRTSHNLWPLEFGMYFVISLAAVAGAVAGVQVRRLVADYAARGRSSREHA